MSRIPEDLKYTREHEWIRLDEDLMEGECGLTDHAQEMLSAILFVELPEIYEEVRQGARVGVVESNKARTDIVSPVSGMIIAVNSALEDGPDLINNDPYGDGWIFKIDVKYRIEVEELLDASQYEEYLASGE